MSGISYNTLVTQIRNYTEVDANVFTTDVLESFILNAQQRIMMDLPMDSDRFVDQGTMATDVNNIRFRFMGYFICLKLNMFIIGSINLDIRNI